MVGELVWVYSPQRKKGRCPKRDIQWVGPGRVLERLGEVVYRVQLPPSGRRVALHRDRLAPYRGNALFPAQRALEDFDLSATMPLPQSPVAPSPGPQSGAVSPPRFPVHADFAPPAAEEASNLVD